MWIFDTRIFLTYSCSDSVSSVFLLEGSGLRKKLRFSFLRKILILVWKSTLISATISVELHNGSCGVDNITKKMHGQLLLMRYMRRGREAFFLLSFSFSRLVNNEAKFAIIHIWIVNKAGDYEQNFNCYVNGLTKQCKERSKQNFYSIWISFKTINISCKITNHLKIGERCCRMGGQNSNIIGGGGNMRRGDRLEWGS